MTATMAATATKTPTIRCAIYTRKSTDEGLDMDFNSLDAHEQRELMSLLIERIVFDRSDETIEIKLHANAIKSLSEVASDDEGEGDE